MRVGDEKSKARVYGNHNEILLVCITVNNAMRKMIEHIRYEKSRNVRDERFKFWWIQWEQGKRKDRVWIK